MSRQQRTQKTSQTSSNSYAATNPFSNSIKPRADKNRESSNPVTSGCPSGSNDFNSSRSPAFFISCSLARLSCPAEKFGYKVYLSRIPREHSTRRTESGHVPARTSKTPRIPRWLRLRPGQRNRGFQLLLLLRPRDGIKKWAALWTRPGLDLGPETRPARLGLRSVGPFPPLYRPLLSPQRVCEERGSRGTRKRAANHRQPARRPTGISTDLAMGILLCVMSFLWL